MRRRISLTFDNGPTPGLTERVLSVLAERGLPATFFVVGDRVGHHTMTHSDDA